MNDLVAIARIARPRGIRGEVVADLLTDFPARFDGLENVTAVLPGDERLELRIEDHWFQGERIILKFVDVDTVDQAEGLRNAEICVAGSEVVELEADQYFDWQLIGCDVETVLGRRLGKVREVMRTGGTENLVIEGDGREYLIPFAHAICVDVDIANGLIRVDPPEGLLEF